jgi:transaldolase
MNGTMKLLEAEQSIWYDNIQRKLLKDGEMARMIRAGEIRGVTSNPTIFMNAIAGSQDYDETLIPLAKAGHNAEQIFWQLAVEDIQTVADLFAPLYSQTNGGDGYVSLEVNPYLANDPAATIEEARKLWQRVNRPNLMVKIPATEKGLPAITEAIAAGMNINVTLIFSRQRYAGVMDAYLSGLEKRLAENLPIAGIASVASFFISRVDTLVDARLQEIIRGKNPQAAEASRLLGKAAIANARLAYADFKEVSASERFQKIQAAGGRPQRPLWASTGTKHPDYRDVVYIEELVGPMTVNTVPPQTLKAFLDHGVVRLGSVEENLAEASQVFESLEALGISMSAATRQLEDEGVQAFSNAFGELLASVERRRLAAVFQ